MPFGIRNPGIVDLDDLFHCRTGRNDIIDYYDVSYPKNETIGTDSIDESRWIFSRNPYALSLDSRPVPFAEPLIRQMSSHNICAITRKNEHRPLDIKMLPVFPVDYIFGHHCRREHSSKFLEGMKLRKRKAHIIDEKSHFDPP